MHDTAHELGKLFFQVYFEDAAPAVLEVGSQDVNGTLRDCTQAVSEYVGVDIAPANGVDVVLEDPYCYPFEDNRFDAVVSSSCFEHDQLFWLSFMEMVRVTKHHGYIYVNVPSNGSYHGYPYDNWRFFPDSGLALMTWAKRQGQELALMESFIARRGVDWWNDCVLVFCKGGTPPNPPAARIVDRVRGPYNVRRNGAPKVEQFTEESEDMILLRETRERLSQREQELAQMASWAGAYEASLLALSRNLGAPAASTHDAAEKLQQLTQQLGGLHGVVEQLRAELAASDQKQAALASEAEQREARLAAEAARLEGEIAARDARMAQLEAMLVAQRDATTAGLDRVVGRLTASEAALPELRAALAASDQKQTALASDAEQREARLAAETARLEGEIAARDARMAQLEAMLVAQGDATTAGLDRVVGRLTASEAAVPELRAALAASDQKQTALASEAEQREMRLAAEAARMAGEITAVGGRLSRLESLTTASGAVLRQIQDEAASERARQAANWAAAEQRAGIARTEIARLERQFSERDNRMDRLETVAAEQRRAATQALEQLRQRLDAELDAISTGQEGLRVGLDAAHAAIAEIQDTAGSQVFPVLQEHAALLRRLTKWRRMLDGMSGKSQAKAGHRAAPSRSAG